MEQPRYGTLRAPDGGAGKVKRSSRAGVTWQDELGRNHHSLQDVLLRVLQPGNVLGRDPQVDGVGALSRSS